MQRRDVIAVSHFESEDSVPLRLVHSDSAVGQKILPFGRELVEIVNAFDVIVGN
jgi:hypothetical protein